MYRQRQNPEHGQVFFEVNQKSHYILTMIKTITKTYN